MTLAEQLRDSLYPDGCVKDGRGRQLEYAAAARIEELEAALRACLPLVERAAAEESRSNLAPTGLAKQTAKKDLLNLVLRAIAKAETHVRP